MPKVLMIANAAVIHSVRWANAIAKRGWDVHVVSLFEAREVLDAKVKVHHAPWSPPAGYFLGVPFARKVLRDVRPDLVHAHYVTGYGTMAVLTGGRPLVMSVWGSDIYVVPAKTPLHAWLIRRNLAASDLVLSTSHAMAEQTRRYTHRTIGITPFGIALDRFKPARVASPFGSSDIVIGTVKTLHPNYGIEYLVRAFALVKDRLPGWPLKLLVVGEGPQEGALKELVAKLGLTGDALFTGRVEHGLVPDYQNMLSISVSVSNSESFGVAVLEASACEKPVVVSAVGGLPEVVEDGVTGFVVPPRDPAKTADAIETLVRDEKLRHRMGQAGRRRVKDLYEWEQCVDRLLRYYANVLAGKVPPAGS